ncbi:hypothetical protein M9458_021226, partial [Cirrhinus mrigala]
LVGSAPTYNGIVLRVSNPSLRTFTISLAGLWSVSYRLLVWAPPWLLFPSVPPWLLPPLSLPWTLVVLLPVFRPPPEPPTACLCQSFTIPFLHPSTVF